MKQVNHFNFSGQEEKINFHINNVLRKVEIVSRYTRSDKFSFGAFNGLGDTENISMLNPEKEYEILKVINDLGAIKLYGANDNEKRADYLEILRPRFSEVCKEAAEREKKNTDPRFRVVRCYCSQGAVYVEYLDERYSPHKNAALLLKKVFEYYAKGNDQPLRLKSIFDDLGMFDQTKTEWINDTKEKFRIISKYLKNKHIPIKLDVIDKTVVIIDKVDKNVEIKYG